MSKQISQQLVSNSHFIFRVKSCQRKIHSKKFFICHLCKKAFLKENLFQKHKIKCLQRQVEPENSDASSVRLEASGENDDRVGPASHVGRGRLPLHVAGQRHQRRQNRTRIRHQIYGLRQIQEDDQG